MKHMTLKQRRRHGELVATFDRLKKDPYLQLPDDYEFGINVEEDEKYRRTIEAFNAVVTEMHDIEEQAQQGN